MTPWLRLFFPVAVASLIGAAACDESSQRPGDGPDQVDGSVSDGEPVSDGPGVSSDSDGAPLVDLMPSPDTHVINPGKDTDGDGLPDGYEDLFSSLDSKKADTDGDKIKDGLEDEDGDGLSAAHEWSAYQGKPVSGGMPSPMHRDLLIELDYQAGAKPTANAMSKFIKAYAAVNLTNLDGKKGINAHIFIDEKNMTATPMKESIDDRLNYLGAHGPKVVKGAHITKMVHVIFATTRPGNASRGGDTISSTKYSAEKAGVLVYVGNLNKIFPTCASPTSAKVTAEEAIISTFVHESGHTLQLGHDTAAGGGINPYNIMSTDLGTCDKLKMRTRGVGNKNPALGANEKDGGPRFSDAATKLMKLKNKISVEANESKSVDM